VGVWQPCVGACWSCGCTSHSPVGGAAVGALPGDATARWQVGACALRSGGGAAVPALQVDATALLVKEALAGQGGLYLQRVHGNFWRFVWGDEAARVAAVEGGQEDDGGVDGAGGDDIAQPAAAAAEAEATQAMPPSQHQQHQQQQQQWSRHKDVESGEGWGDGEEGVGGQLAGSCGGHVVVGIHTMAGGVAGAAAQQLRRQAVESPSLPATGGVAGGAEGGSGGGGGGGAGHGSVDGAVGGAGHGSVDAAVGGAGEGGAHGPCAPSSSNSSPRPASAPSSSAPPSAPGSAPGSTSSSPPSAPPSDPGSTSSPDCCVVCYDERRPVDAVLVCGHAFCSIDAAGIIQRRLPCPYCRAPARLAVRALDASVPVGGVTKALAPVDG